MSENLNLNQPNQLDPEDHEALTQQLDFEGFKGLVDQYGLDGATPQDRLKALKGATSENIALFLTDLNRQLQGESQTQIHNETMSVGESKTISPQDRFDLFNYAIDKIKNTDDETNPADVREYIDDLLSKNDEYLYVSPAGEVAPLKVTSSQG